MSKWIKVWFAVAMSFIISFGVPLAAAFYLFSRGVEGKEHGGILFYGVTSIVLIFLIMRLNFILKKIKMSFIKILIKTTVVMGICYFLYQILLYVDSNTELLAQQLLAVVGGLVLSLPFKAWALRIDKEFIERIGVFG